MAKISRVGHAHPDFFQGGHLPTLLPPCRRPWDRGCIAERQIGDSLSVHMRCLKIFTGQCHTSYILLTCWLWHWHIVSVMLKSSPTSTPADCLFSIGNLILTLRRNLSDAVFQQLLMLKKISSVVKQLDDLSLSHKNLSNPITQDILLKYNDLYNHHYNIIFCWIPKVTLVSKVTPKQTN